MQHKLQAAITGYNPKHYPSRRVTEDYIITNPSVIVAIGESTALELEYEQLCKGIRNIPDKADLHETLQFIEERLLHHYLLINSIFDEETAEEKAHEMLAETLMLAEQSKAA